MTYTDLCILLVLYLQAFFVHFLERLFHFSFSSYEVSRSTSLACNLQQQLFTIQSTSCHIHPSFCHPAQRKKITWHFSLLFINWRSWLDLIWDKAWLQNPLFSFLAYIMSNFLVTFHVLFTAQLLDQVRTEENGRVCHLVSYYLGKYMHIFIMPSMNKWMLTHDLTVSNLRIQFRLFEYSCRTMQLPMR